jgi:predicted anti-sigma-YlaC factor YlaD
MTATRLTCRECVEFLVEYLEETMAPDVRVTFERHLAACANCVRYLESYKTTASLCKKAFELREGDALPAVPEELIQAILAARPKADA